jgi:hypothetical protein
MNSNIRRRRNGPLWSCVGGDHCYEKCVWEKECRRRTISGCMQYKAVEDETLLIIII